MQQSVLRRLAPLNFDGMKSNLPSALMPLMFGEQPEVYRQRFWMALLGSKTPKSTLVWSNDQLVKHLDVGQLRKSKMKESTSRNLVERFVPIIIWTLGETLHNHHTKVLTMTAQDERDFKEKAKR